jgi:hypothetical protein
MKNLLVLGMLFLALSVSFSFVSAQSLDDSAPVIVSYSSVGTVNSPGLSFSATPVVVEPSIGIVYGNSTIIVPGPIGSSTTISPIDPTPGITYNNTPPAGSAGSAGSSNTSPIDPTIIIVHNNTPPSTSAPIASPGSPSPIESGGNNGGGNGGGGNNGGGSGKKIVLIPEEGGRRRIPLNFTDLSTTPDNSNEDNGSFFSQITGAVIGVLGKRGALGVGIFIVVVAVATIVVYNRRSSLKAAPAK